MFYCVFFFICIIHCVCYYCVSSIPNCCKFVAWGWHESFGIMVSCSWFPIYITEYVFVLFGNGDVQKKIYFIIIFFNSKFHGRCYVVERIEYIMYISCLIFINSEDVICVTNIQLYDVPTECQVFLYFWGIDVFRKR